MIIINSAMPKSGSTLLYFYQRDMLEKKIGEKRALKSIKTFSKFIPTTFVNQFNFKIVVLAIWVNFRYGGLAIKTHCKYDKWIKILKIFPFVKITYSYRDPRDVLLSGMDHHKRNNERFLNWNSWDNSIKEVKRNSIEAVKWLENKEGFFVAKYEDFIPNQLTTIKMLNNYLGFNLSDNLLEDMVKSRINNKETTINFNKGVINRYKQEIKPEDLVELEKTLQEYIIKLNYTLSTLNKD